MPLRALETTTVDYCVTVAELPELLQRLIRQRRDEEFAPPRLHREA